MLSATAMIRHVNKHIWAGFAATACLAVAVMSAQNNRPPAPPGVTGSPTAPTSQARNTPNVGSLAQVSKAPLGLNEDLPAGRQNVAANLNQLSRSKREAVRRDRGELTTGGLHTSLGSNALEGRHMAPDCGIRYRCITTPSRSVKLVRFNGIHGSRGLGAHRQFAQVVELATT